MVAHIIPCPRLCAPPERRGTGTGAPRLDAAHTSAPNLSRPTLIHHPRRNASPNPVHTSILSSAPSANNVWEGVWKGGKSILPLCHLFEFLPKFLLSSTANHPHLPGGLVKANGCFVYVASSPPPSPTAFASTAAPPVKHRSSAASSRTAATRVSIQQLPSTA